ncbi:ABC transporter substrate-binding protein [Thiomicrorhabdus indica]|uniref:ABC transporter substrate-binding protein n=1 Tax=Thiomicrorhabdus indica TaxID=2267253 RepID=UPI00102DD536|nr:extracellular solute-binding protein [Thiomicrorhabdus indica]
MTSRREFIYKGLLAAASISSAGFPGILHAQNKRPTVKVVGTHVTLQPHLKARAEKELGINLEFYPGGSAEVLLKATTDPTSFDLYEQWSNSVRPLWQADAIQPIETSRLKYWNEISPLAKTGKLTEKAKIGAGDSPNKILFIQPNGTLGPNPTDQITFMPYVHNVDSFGYNTQKIPAGIPYETESWGWLLDNKYQGRVALVNDPTIGLFDAALAIQAQGFMSFKDIGNFSRDELDQMFTILTDLKSQGQFRGVWSSVPHSIKLMATHQVDIQSMFSPAVASLNGMGVPCIYAAPKEGYRAWHGVMSLSSESRGESKDAAYEYMNWWLSGYAGAFIARQGYYISNPERSRQFMSQAEWDYWYLGKPASEMLQGTDGKNSIKAGEIRTGGSYHRRFENIAVWNTVIPNYEYSLRKWNEFVLAGV